MDDDNHLLRVSDLTVRLDNRLIIDHLSFSLNQNDIISILGPNGSGKTVLLKCLLGLLPFHGTITWKKGIKIGYVPQRLPFIKEIPLSVGEFFSLKNVSKQEIIDILNAVGFEKVVCNRKTGDLSSGQFQRLLIAWSLIGNPDVLLFDEPTTGIDIGGEETIYHLLEDLKNKNWYQAMLLVTHDLNVVYQFSNQVICLNKKTVCIGPPREALTPDNLRILYGGDVKFYKHNH
ncbi:metal ABC transporter ATP-binding protein [Legionella spiritensis]|uniref:ABC transporter ATP-binding protein n=1 Tax=Legionella spiritensis TaxID=452 RepID=A0A0W0YYE3_LEGSP|nr:metal ABC transporter ATP-binding protein [Legionella spiritensis]KTD61851.1 ABC transporter ATP-binding protein [Legionella spiritensis]SNV31474.1 ABC transporter ATP-binding protein [Legionella spiritensis]